MSNPNSTDRNSPFDESTSKLNMEFLQSLLRERKQRRPFFENIAILGCGYVGSALAEHWQEQGQSVTATTTSRERVVSLSETVSKAVLMKGDDFTAVHSLLQGQSTLVISVAPSGFREADETAYETTYMTTAKNLVKALSQTPEVTQVIYLSSCSVYGDRQGEWVDETALIHPLDHKSQVLYQAEQIILQAANDRQKVCILRLGGIYGPGRELVSMFGGLAGATMPEKGDRFINWIHRDDIVGAIEFVRLNELEGIYNLVDDSQLTVKEQVSRICSRYNLPPVRWASSQFNLQRKNLQVSNQKFKTAGYDLIHPQILV